MGATIPPWLPALRAFQHTMKTLLPLTHLVVGLWCKGNQWPGLAIEHSKSQSPWKVLRVDSPLRVEVMVPLGDRFEKVRPGGSQTGLRVGEAARPQVPVPGSLCSPSFPSQMQRKHPEEECKRPDSPGPGSDSWGQLYHLALCC